MAFDVVALLLYPLAVAWPSGWAWHAGAPYQSMYFMVIVGIYATLGAFLLNAAPDPRAALVVASGLKQPGGRDLTRE